METSLNRLTATAVTVVMAGIIAYAGTHGRQSSPQTTSNVLVTNASTQPVPVSFPHTPTVAALQSGPWKISGIANVHVFNNQTAPVPTRSDSDEQGYTANLSQNIASGNSTADFSVTVPAGKRLFIDRVAIYCRAPSGNQVYMLSIYRYSNANGPGGVEYIPVTTNPNPGGNEFLGVADTKVFADGGDVINMQAVRDANVANQSCLVQIGLFGHYLTLP